MGKIKEYINEFYLRLENLLKKEGFKVYKSKNEILKGTKQDWCKITFDMNKMYDFTYNVNCQFAVRNGIIRHHLEKILQRDGLKGDHWFSLMYRPNKLCECYYPGRNDWESEINKETNLSGRVVDFGNNKTIDEWFRGFELFMNEVGYDFFNRFEDVTGYNKWLNEPILNNPQLIETYIYWDSFSGLIAAKLCENPYSEQVYEIWKQHFETVKNKEALQEIIDLKNFLDNYSPNELHLMAQA